MKLLPMLRIQICNLINIESFSRIQIKNHERSYSVYPKYYNKPIVSKDEQKELESEGKIKELGYLAYKPASTNETSSEFYDPVVAKFINYLTKDGKKINARCLLERVFETIKVTQLQKYNKASPEKKEEIELDPKKILAKAIENASPVLELTRVKHGSQTYQVPSPVVPNRSRFLGVKWILAAAKEKRREQFVSDRIAEELLDAFHNHGRVIKKKEDLYKQCIANKSYAHYRWS